MESVDKLRHDIEVTKRELKNMRQEILKQKANMKKEAESIISLFSETSATPIEEIEKENSNYSMTPIGYISSCFKFKNGIPRQPSLCPTAKGTLKIEKTLFTNPEHSLIGLKEFSHIWLIFVFHANGHTAVKAKVHPPRLNGASLGVFSTRSPHRPSALGLSLTKLDKVEGDTLYLSGIDLLDGTPILDIKPYIPMYDNPAQFNKNNSDDKTEESLDSFSNETIEDVEKILGNDYEKKDEIHCSPKKCVVPEFLEGEFQTLDVVFTNRAQSDLENVCLQSKEYLQSDKCLDDKLNVSDIKQTITEILKNDPRSVYRREKCTDRLYYFYIANFHITCWFDDKIVEVLKVRLPETNTYKKKNAVDLGET